MSTDDRDGGREPHPDDAGYVFLPSRQAAFAWRLRLGGSATAVVFVMAGQSTALLFLACLGLASCILVAGSALARLEARITHLRTERRR